MKFGKYPIVESEPVHVRVEHVRGKEMLIYADTRLVTVIPCDRCLEDVRYEFALDFAKHVDIGLSDAELTEELDESKLSVTYLRILRRCNLCQSAQRINLLKQEEIKEELTGR